MKNLIIIGAGGMGRTVYDLANESVGYGEDFSIKGFLDDNLQVLDGFEHYPPLLGRICEYIPQQNDVFISSIGGNCRVGCTETIEAKGGKFVNIIHKTARIGTNVKMGHGNLIGAFVSIGADVCIGNYNMIQSYTVIGHDARIGNEVRIDTQVVCVGGIIVEDEVSIHTHAVISHNVIVGQGAKVGACSFVMRKVKPGTTVFGVPAKIL
ncbi:sialic acid O-acetyltransferase [Culturomica massiliensis]|uniref:PglD-related sugar-binding protein n=1 Tax=Culturomica massiliensis TaxID=1841857 RepID=UPI0025F82EC3|nr:sialic acid O-acetyltransferase [Culturomica massiliensis]